MNTEIKLHPTRGDFSDFRRLVKYLINAPLALIVLAVLTACTDGHVSFPRGSEGQQSLGNNVDVVTLDAENVGNFNSHTKQYHATELQSDRDWEYHPGPGDILSVVVFNHPELTLPTGPQRTAAESGFQVSNEGTINYPFIGTVSVSGRPIEQIREDITRRLATFIPDPQVDVRIAAFNSQSIIVSGEVETPNTQPLTTIALTLIEAINEAGGFSEQADLRNVSLQREGRLYEVDIQGFLSGGLRQNNPILRNGDLVSVPRRRAEEAYILGEVARPDVVDLSLEPISLTQAITRRGGLQLTRSDARGILVFRSAGIRTLVFQLDTSSPAGLLLGTRFVLEPGDVVYVLRSPLQYWSDTITRLLPTVQAIDAYNRITN